MKRDMDQHDDYMQAFYLVFERMRRQGPGSAATTLRVLDRIRRSAVPTRILDLGCGTGESSLLLAERTGAAVTAIDNHEQFLVRLRQMAEARGLKNIEARCADMATLAYPPSSFDLLWAEGSAYIIGFRQALEIWKPLLAPRGHLFLTDAVWLTPTPSPACQQFWQREYPDMATLAERERQATELGYEVIDSFTLPREDWEAFYGDMEEQIRQASEQIGDHPALDDLRREIGFYREFGDEYSYGCLILRQP